MPPPEASPNLRFCQTRRFHEVTDTVQSPRAMRRRVAPTCTHSDVHDNNTASVDGFPCVSPSWPMAKGDGAEGPPFTNTQGEQAEGRGFCTTKAEDDARVLPFSGSLLSPLTPAHKEQAERSSPSCRGGSSQLTENGPDEAELIPEAKRRCVSFQDLTLCSPSPPGETHTSGLAPGSEPPSSSSPFRGARPPAHCRVPSTGGNRASDLTTADGELEAAIVASVLELSKLQHDSLVGHRR